MPETEQITQSQLRAQIAPLIPQGIDPEQVMEGVELALVPRADRTLPLVKNPFNRTALYAWSENDASAVKLALNLLSETASALLTGHASLLNLGIGLKEIVCFLIDLKRHHVRLDDPLQIKILFLLRDADAGLSADQIRERLGTAASSPSAIEQGLSALQQTFAESGPRPLVRCDRMIWKILV